MYHGEKMKLWINSRASKGNYASSLRLPALNYTFITELKTAPQKTF
ncbi:hypothetical protein SAMN05216490_4934 [Mucilaginibacter mallensis]|uniref:Uncharacterized protein n=1 Tax=Mucilaginibacter mallensis TaxID=652787 RepID=A0A1H2CEZ0_MUCMA|nr:hypothetical protein SAMN05216490_4934 [Mucilaginibacter mallensis]